MLQHTSTPFAYREGVSAVRVILAVILLFFLGSVGIFAVQNTQPITVQFLKWGITAPVAIMAVAVYFLGMISGWNVIAFLRRSFTRVTEASRQD